MCAQPKPLQRVADWHRGPLPPLTKGCESRRRLVRIVPPIYGLWHCFTHTSCVCNDVVSIVNRVIGEVPDATPKGISILVRQRLLFQRKIGTFQPLTLEQALTTFKGTKLKIYKRAYDSLMIKPIGEYDARIKAFVKAEKMNPLEKENPDPRMIQSRDPRYNLHLARYLRSIEHIIYGYRINGLRSVAKCLNPVQRAEILSEKWACFEDPVCFSLDCSRWDKHVNLAVLQQEHKFYMSCYPGDEFLEWLLKQQQNNKCVTSNGVRYAVRGGRMSGDINTALGNVLLALFMVQGSMQELDIAHYQVLDDGDDVLVLIEREHFARVNAALPGLFLAFGQELKIENVAYNIRDVVFCQAKYTWNGERFVMARPWRKVLSQACCGTKHWNVPRLVPGMMGLIGDCEMAQHCGVPILQVFAEQLRQLSKGQRASFQMLDSGYQYRIGSWLGDTDLTSIKARPIDIWTRVEFERTWGVTVFEQLAIEKQLRDWAPQYAYRDSPQEFNEIGWTQNLDPYIPIPTVL